MFQLEARLSNKQTVSYHHPINLDITLWTNRWSLLIVDCIVLIT